MYHIYRLAGPVVNARDILFVGEVHPTQMGEGIYFSIENTLLYSESTTKKLDFIGFNHGLFIRVVDGCHHFYFSLLPDIGYDLFKGRGCCY